MACRNCHLAKVKCDKETPCTRCVRRHLTCEPHRSRQGQGSKKRKTADQDDDSESLTPEIALFKGTTALGKDHFGLHYLIRSWVSYAFSRRSFALLEKASSLANKCGIHMDEIICGMLNQTGNQHLTSKPNHQHLQYNHHHHAWTGHQQAMNFLAASVVLPASQQAVAGTRILWEELPHELLMATHCADAAALEERWICAREMNSGSNRFFVSHAFERDVVSWETIQSTWVQNKAEVRSLWSPPEDTPAFNQCLTHQISLHSRPGVKPSPIRVPAKFKIGNQILEVDCIRCWHIVNLDLSYSYEEWLVPPTWRANNEKAGTLFDDELQFLQNVASLNWPHELDAWVSDLTFG